MVKTLWVSFKSSSNTHGMFKNKWYLSQMFQNDHCHWSNVLQGQRERSVSSAWRLRVPRTDLNLWRFFQIHGLEAQGWKSGLQLRWLFKEAFFFFYSSLDNSSWLKICTLCCPIPAPWCLCVCVCVVYVYYVCVLWALARMWVMCVWVLCVLKK